MRKLILVLAAVLAAAMLLSCSKGKEEAKPADSSPVLATVDGSNITADDYREEATSLSPAAISALNDPANREKFLDNLINKQLIVEKADAAGYDKDPVIAKRLAQFRSTLLLGMFVKKEVLDKVAVSDQEIKDYFDKKKDSLGAVRLSHILVGSQKEAQEVLGKLKAGGDFASLAKQYSLDTKTKGQGGDLGWVRWSQFGSASLKDAAFNLKPGETSGIVQSQFGFHIMKVTDKKPAADADFAAIKDSLKEQVLEKKKEELFDSIVKALREKATVKKNPENLKAVAVTSPTEVPAAR